MKLEINLNSTKVAASLWNRSATRWRLNPSILISRKQLFQWFYHIARIWNIVIIIASFFTPPYYLT